MKKTLGQGNANYKSAIHIKVRRDLEDRIAENLMNTAT